jgi:serine/threonine protein kinase
MELLTGRCLREAMVHDMLGLARILPIARQISGALQAVHAVGIVHRDLKPENVYLCDDGEGGDLIKILDFGVAKFTRGEVTHKTQAGMAMGSPWYMAPEQARGANVDPRADVYSLGVMLYELLTGRVPFAGDSYAAVLSGHLSKPPPPLRRRDGWVPPEALSRVVLRCLEKEPDARPADMESAWQELADAAGPQYTAACTTPARLRFGRTPRSSRVTLPLTGSDPPIRLTPIEGEPVVPAGNGPSDSGLPVALSSPTELAVLTPNAELDLEIKPSPDLAVEVTPSVEGAPEPFPSLVLGPSPRRRRLSLWVLAALGATVGFVGGTLMLTQGPETVASASASAPHSPAAAQTASNPPPTPPSEAPQATAAAAPVPSPETTVEPRPRAASKRRRERPASEPKARTPRRQPPRARPTAKPRRPTASKSPSRDLLPPPRESRDAILDPFR